MKRLLAVYNSPHVLLLFAVLFWAGNFIVARLTRSEVPPIGLAFWRWLGASILILGFALSHLKKDWPRIAENWPTLLLLSATGVASYAPLAYAGLQHSVALNGFLMQSTIPVLVVGISLILFGDRISLVQLAGIAVSMVGVLGYVVKGDIDILLSLTLNRGDIYFFSAAVAYSVYSVLLRKRPSIHPLSFLATTFVPGAAMLFPLYLWEAVYVRPTLFNSATIAAVSYTMVFPSIVSYFCFNRGVELIGANRAGLFIHLMPIFGGIMAVFFLGESFRWFHGASAILIGLGITLTTGIKKKVR